MRIKSKVLALFFLILAACVPENGGTSLAFAKTASETVPSAVSSYVLYLQAKQDQDYKNAISYLKQTIDEDPENIELNSEMFTLLAMEGRIAEAAPYARRELKENPSSLLALLVVTVQNVKEYKYKETIEIFESYPNKAQNGFLIPLLETWVYAGMKDHKKAEQALENVNGEGTEALYKVHKALLNDMWGKSEEAQKNYEALLEEPGGLSLRVAQVYGNFLLRQGDDKKFATLLDAYRRGNRPYPLLDETFFTGGASAGSKKIVPSISTPQAGLAEAFFDISGSLVGKGSPESSLFFVRFGLDLDPHLSLARILLGEILESQGRYQEALALYEEDGENSETYFSSQMLAASILAREGEIGKAESKLQNLAKQRPDLPLPWIQMGDMFLTGKNFDAAAKAYTEALKRVPVPQKSHWSLFYSRGVAYERNKQWELAEQDFSRAMMLNPEQPLILNYLGYSWLERGKNVRKAKEMLEKAAARSPQDGFIMDSLGWAYYLLGNHKKSVSVLETAVAQDPGSAVINDHLGDAYWRMGRQREAAYQWRKALDVNDDLTPEDRKRVEEKLEKGLDAIGDKITLPDDVLLSLQDAPKRSKVKNDNK